MAGSALGFQKALHTAEDRGYDAGLLGAGIMDCPYAAGGMAERFRRAWLEGLDRAKRVMEAPRIIQNLFGEPCLSTEYGQTPEGDYGAKAVQRG